MSSLKYSHLHQSVWPISSKLCIFTIINVRNLVMDFVFLKKECLTMSSWREKGLYGHPMFRQIFATFVVTSHFQLHQVSDVFVVAILVVTLTKTNPLIFRPANSHDFARSLTFCFVFSRPPDRIPKTFRFLPGK